MAGTKKTPLAFGLGKFATAEVRQDVLMITHAVLSTAMVKAAAKGGDAIKVAAKCEAYAEAIQEIEEELGNAYSAVPNLPRTHFVSDKKQIPTQK